MTELQKEKAKACFKANPEHQKYHVTGDGQCFTRPSDADAHSKTLTDKKVVEIDRRDVVSNKETDEFQKKAAEAKQKAIDDEKAAAEKKAAEAKQKEAS